MPWSAPPDITRFQFTPLREGRRTPSIPQTRGFFISIHAPARGATSSLFCCCGGYSISIHAPARGATRNTLSRSKRIRISIHAPARGATGKKTWIRAGLGRFQFTPLREGRHAPTSVPSSSLIFQFTPLREGRLGNAIALLMAFGIRISIHAPARGATQSRAAAGRLGPISIHAPARGATGTVPHCRRRWPNFNSRPCERGDDRCGSARAACKFQFTPLREGRPCSSCGLLSPPYFNSRPCERGDTTHYSTAMSF